MLYVFRKSKKQKSKTGKDITDEYLDAFKTLRLNRDFEKPSLFQRMNKALFG